MTPPAKPRASKKPARIDKAPEPERRRAMRIFKKLHERYPDAHCALDHRNAFELLAATILSAQCTDVRVNKVTPALFKACPDPESMSRANTADLEELVRTTGFFRNKAKNLRGMAIGLVEDYDGQVPQTMDDLLTLPGVARKTANVVLGNAFGINEGMVVDTHIGRLSSRFGFTDADPKNAVRIERDLMGLFPRPKWTLLAHLLIDHGRAVCKATGAKCHQDPLCKAYCSNAKKN
ncbi:MAG: endonuclease III [Planctomycetota bacterium]